MYKIEIAKESRRKKEMKKKFVVALVAAMSLTVAGTGTVFAMNNFHIHGENCEWVVDKAAYDEVVKHPEEGHYEKVEVSPEEGHFETVHHEAVTEQKWVVDKPAVYEDRVIVDKEAWDEEVVVVDKPAWDEEVEVPEQGHYETVVVKPAWDEEVVEILDVCHNCGHIVTSPEDWIAHSKQNINCSSYGSKEVTHIIHHEAVVEQQWKVDVPAHTEIVHHDAITHIEIVHHDAITHIERVEVSPEEGHYETVVIKPAYDEEVWVVDKEAVYEDKWIVDKEAWEETVHHKEEGHWVCNGEPQEPEQKPENPDVETPETPDAENPATPEQKPEVPTTPEENKENVQTQATETKKEGTSPKTGDTTSALPVAGAGLASLGVALATILKKRK